jgi:hypothetical protein
MQKVPVQTCKACFPVICNSIPADIVLLMLLSRVLVTRDGVRIGNWIY